MSKKHVVSHKNSIIKFFKKYKFTRAKIHEAEIKLLSFGVKLLIIGGVFYYFHGDHTMICGAVSLMVVLKDAADFFSA